MTLKIANILLYLSMVLSWGCSNQEEDILRQLDLEFKEIRTIGQGNGSPETELIRPSGVRMGPDGNVYIADPFRHRIHVYSPEGEFLHLFGQNGRGPGEFLRMTGFGLVDSTVFVWDQDLQRLNQFALNGIYKTSHTLKGVSSPMNIYPDGQDYLLMYPDTHGPPVENRRLAHVYDRTFSENMHDYIQVDEIDDRIAEINWILMGYESSTMYGDEDRLLFVPFVYSGRMFEYQRGESGNWKLDEIHRGQIQQTPYTLVSENATREPDKSLHTIYLNEPLRMILHNQSRGLFRKGEYIYHFIQTDREDQRVFGVEVYDLNLQPYGFSPITSIPINGERFNTIAWFVDDMDNDGNFYFREHYPDSSRIRVMQIETEGIRQLNK